MRRSLALLAVLLATAHGDWVNELKLTLQNYALSRATSEPDGFKCDTVGKKHSSCHCWNDKGKAAHDQTDDDCHMPAECLMYDDKSTGQFNFTNVTDRNNHLLHYLRAWNVPTKMHEAYELAEKVESSTFAVFHLDVNDHKAHFDAHVGTLRKQHGIIYIGYLAASTDGDMVQPMRRTDKVPPGDCHGSTRGMKERGYTDDEIARIDQGLQAYAYRKAAKEAYPGGQWDMSPPTPTLV